MVSVGEKAPEVTLRLTDTEHVNKDFNLKEAYGKGTTVLYFFPAAFTGVCTKSSCELRDSIKEFQELHAQLYGVSVDSPFVHKKFHNENNLTYPLLSDWNKKAISAFKIEDNNFANGLVGFSKRSIFAIKNNIIIYKWIADSPGNYPPFSELKEKLT